MKYRLLLIFAFALSLFSLFGAEKELNDVLTLNKDILWSIKPEQCSEIFGVKFIPQDKFNNVMRYHMKDSMQYVRFNQRIVTEIIFYFEKRHLQSITISLYNRGDNGAMDDSSFAQLNSQAEKFAAAFSNDSEPVNETRKFDKFRIESIIWQDKVCDYVLRRNRKGKYPEYLQIVIYPAGKAKKLRDALRSAANKNQLQLNLNIQSDGDHYLDIPMVNQGAKGYCVDASVERILKYYGSRIDQQIIAQLAESDAYKGTNIRKIINVLDKNKSKLQINVNKLIFDDIFSLEDLQKLTQTYNNFAKKQKRKRLNFNDFCSGKGRYRRLDIAALIGNYDYDLFREARCKNKREVEKFAESIQNSLNKGIPLAWVTFTFLNMKDGQQIGKFGLHMRIINGFNQQTNQIIYTDSWGRGHEKKYMGMNDARAITLMLLQITPK